MSRAASFAHLVRLLVVVGMLTWLPGFLGGGFGSTRPVAAPSPDLSPPTSSPERAFAASYASPAATAVTLSVAGVDPTAADLAWTPTNDPVFTSNEVDQSSQGPAGPWAELANLTTQSTDQYVAVSLVPGAAYWFRIVSYDLLTGVTGWAVSNVVESVQPPVATLTFVPVTNTSADLQWTNDATYGGNLSFVSYELDESVDGGPSAKAATITDSSATSFAASSLESGTNYAFQVITSDACGCGVVLTSSSNLVSFGTPTPVHLSAPGVDPTAVSLAWTPATESNFGTYQVDESTAGVGGPWTTLANLSSESSVAWGAGQLSPATPYWFRVVDYDGFGTASSNLLTLSSSQEPSLIYSSPNSTSLLLSWTNGAVYGGGISFVEYLVNESVNGAAFSTLTTLNNPAALQYTVSPLASGTGYAFQVLGVDVCCESRTNYQRSNVVSMGTPQQLTVTASGSPSSTDAGQSVSFTCTASGGVAPYTYSWTFGDGSSESGQTVSHVYSTASTYQATCTATDLDLISSTATVTEIVSPPSSAVITSNSFAAAPGTALNFQVSASGGPGTYVNYSWTMGDGSQAYGVSVSHAYSTPGQYTVTVTVVDTNQGTATGTHALTIAALKVTATSSASETTPGLMVIFNASATGGAGAPYTFTWNFGDGTSGGGSSVSHAYATPGDYAVSVVAKDVLGESNTTQDRTLLVYYHLQAAIGVSISDPAPGESVSLSAVITGGSGTYSCAWKYGDGSTGSGCVVAHTWATTGTYSVYLSVVDPQAGTTSAASSVVVTPSTSHPVSTSHPSDLSNLRWVVIVAVVAAGLMVLWAVLRRRPDEPAAMDEEASAGIREPEAEGPAGSEEPAEEPPPPPSSSPRPADGQSSSARSKTASRQRSGPSAELCPNCGSPLDPSSGTCARCVRSVLGD